MHTVVTKKACPLRGSVYLSLPLHTAGDLTPGM